MTSVSAGHIILTPTQPVGSGRPQRGSNAGPPHPESCVLPTERPRPLACASDFSVFMHRSQMCRFFFFDIHLTKLTDASQTLQISMLRLWIGNSALHTKAAYTHTYTHYIYRLSSIILQYKIKCSTVLRSILQF